jgi:hypothetical protein
LNQSLLLLLLLLLLDVIVCSKVPAHLGKDSSTVCLPVLRHPFYKLPGEGPAGSRKPKSSLSLIITFQLLQKMAVLQQWS